MKPVEQRLQWPWYEAPDGLLIDLRHIMAVAPPHRQKQDFILLRTGDDGFVAQGFPTEEAAEAERLLVVAELRKPRFAQVAVWPNAPDGECSLLAVSTHGELLGKWRFWQRLGPLGDQT
jgi:hypothetical protein